MTQPRSCIILDKSHRFESEIKREEVNVSIKDMTLQIEALRPD